MASIDRIMQTPLAVAGKRHFRAMRPAVDRFPGALAAGVQPVMGPCAYPKAQDRSCARRYTAFAGTARST